MVGAGGFNVVDRNGLLRTSGIIDRNNYNDFSEGSINVTRAALALLLPDVDYDDVAQKYDSPLDWVRKQLSGQVSDADAAYQVVKNVRSGGSVTDISTWTNKAWSCNSPAACQMEFIARKSVGSGYLALQVNLSLQSIAIESESQWAKQPGSAVAKVATNTGAKLPGNATQALETIEQTGAAPAGYKGGSTFANDGRAAGQVLPKNGPGGGSITYKEWDVNPYTKGVNRGAERLVTGSDGSVYYTNNHYTTFTKVK